MKKLLILGANPETAMLVRTAQKMGVYTIVVDGIPGSFAKKIADESFDIDGMDVDRLADLIGQEGIDGVIVGTADPLIRPYRELCERTGLPCYAGKQASLVLTDKRLFKDKCIEYGIEGVPEYGLDECLSGSVEYPVIVKPADGRSGKGMTLCYNSSELDGAILKAKEFSRSGEYIIEQYMGDCEDVFTYYTFKEGKCFLSAMADRYTTKEQSGAAPVVLGAVYPSKHLNEYLQVLHSKMCEMFKGLQIEDGVLLIQFFYNNGKFYPYDPGFRLQGGAPHLLVANINGFDHREMLVNFALTGNMGNIDLEEMNDPGFKGKVAASQTILLRRGIIKRIEGIDTISRKPEVIATTQRLWEGDDVFLEGTEQQVLVRFHMVCETMVEMRKLMKEINSTVKAYDTEDKNMCLGGLTV